MVKVQEFRWIGCRYAGMQISTEDGRPAALGVHRMSYDTEDGGGMRPVAADSPPKSAHQNPYPCSMASSINPKGGGPTLFTSDERRRRCWETR